MEKSAGLEYGAEYDKQQHRVLLTETGSGRLSGSGFFKSLAPSHALQLAAAILLTLRDAGYGTFHEVCDAQRRVARRLEVGAGIVPRAGAERLRG